MVFQRKQWDQAIAYIEATPAIRDVLLSGGDPLTLPDEKLEYLLSRLRQIPHVEMLRIGTKAPVVSAASYHAGAHPDAQALSSPLDEHSFHPSR